MTKSITTFDIVLVPFPFTDLQAKKKRPCLILYENQGLVIVCMITSQIQKKYETDFLIGKYAEAGLPKPSLIRLCKMVTLEQSLIDKKLGSLDPTDQNEIKSLFQQIFPWFK